MKKGIRVSAINNVAKKAALGAMLAGSVAGYATNPVKTFAENPNHTEVVSNKGAEALKALAYPMLQQQKQSVPTTHNKALDEKFLKFCNTPEEINMIDEFINNIYKEYGTYLGSATIQQNIDLNIFLEFLDGNVEILKKFDENAYNKIDKEAMKKVTAKSEPIKQWLNENYFNVYNQPFGQFAQPPGAEEVSKALDQYLESDPYNLFGDKNKIRNDYFFVSNIGKRKLANTSYDNIQKDTYYIAYKTSCANYLLFFNLLKSFGVDITNHGNNIDSNLVKYMVSVQPFNI